MQRRGEGVTDLDHFSVCVNRCNVQRRFSMVSGLVNLRSVLDEYLSGHLLEERKHIMTRLRSF